MSTLMSTLMRPITLIICAALILTGCGGSDQQNPDDLPAARPLLEGSADQIQNAHSLEVEMNVEGYPVKFAADHLESFPVEWSLIFKYARASFLSPDRLQATIQFGVADASTTAELIALDRDHYFRSSLLTANRWLNMEVIPGFSPAALMARPGGIAYALLSITDLEMVGRDDVDGLDVFHLRGTVQASALYSLTFGLIHTREGDLRIEVYIGVKDRRVSLIKIHEPPPPDADDPENTTWRINILDYNQDISITPPPIETIND
jgi:hypothetical protein